MAEGTDTGTGVDAPGFTEEQLRSLEPILQCVVEKCLKERDGLAAAEEGSSSRSADASEPSKQGRRESATVTRGVGPT